MKRFTVALAAAFLAFLVYTGGIATPTPTPAPTPTPTPGPRPTPGPTPTPTPTGCGPKQTSWVPPSSTFVPLSDATAASQVCRSGFEPRSDNADENTYRPTPAELAATMGTERNRFGQLISEWNPRAEFVTGNFSGTTDEILQWAAHKWGIPEDWIRAQAVTESNWHMSQLGDRRTVADSTRYPVVSRITGTSDLWESLGIMQIKWNHGDPARNNAGTGAEPLRWKSTAFNADYTYAQIRYYFDGLCDWCGKGYSAGQEWPSIGAWFNPSPWNSAGDYISHVQAHLASRDWARASF